MNPYLALTRPGNVILTAVAVIAGSFIAAGDNIVDFQIEILIASISAMMLVGGGNALNDYNDRESDKENHPNRPIPAGLISAEDTLIFSRILLAGGLLVVLFGLANKLPFIHPIYHFFYGIACLVIAPVTIDQSTKSKSNSIQVILK